MRKKLFCLLALMHAFSGCENLVARKDNNHDLKQLVHEWDKAHNTRDIGVFSRLYNHSLAFYGEYLDKNACITIKLSLFKKIPDFFEQIVGDIQLEEMQDKSVKCTFLKRVTAKQETKDYVAYLIFRKVGTEWKISAESDLTTDANLAKRRMKSAPNGSIKGDFDGDGMTEYVWLEKPTFPSTKNEDDSNECIGECACFLRFTRDRIPPIKIESCIGGEPVNEGDLNDDGADEIGILPHWWTSCWREYQVFTLRNRRWKFAVAPFSTHCNQWDQGIDAIRKDRSRPNHVVIHYSHHTGEDIVTLSESIPVER